MPIMKVLLFTVCYCCSAGRVFQYIYTKLYQRVSANFKICREVVICKGKGWESGRESKGDGGVLFIHAINMYKHFNQINICYIIKERKNKETFI